MHVTWKAWRHCPSVMAHSGPKWPWHKVQLLSMNSDVGSHIWIITLFSFKKCTENILCGTHPSSTSTVQSIFLDLSFEWWFVRCNIWSMLPQVVHSVGPPMGRALIILNLFNEAFTALPSSTDVVALSWSACIAVHTMCPLLLNQWTQPSQDNWSSFFGKYCPIHSTLGNALNSICASSHSLLATPNFCTINSNVPPCSNTTASSMVPGLNWGLLHAASCKLLMYGPLEPSPKKVNFSFPFHRASRGRDNLSKVTKDS
jgi:hypothetical protein